MDPFMKKVHDRPINGKYRLVKKLGRGGFGSVYLARDQTNGREVALKLEHHSFDPSFVRDEVRRYEAFDNVVGFPHVYWFGQHDDFRVMAFELLGPSLEDVFAYCGYRFSLKTTLMIADQILCILERLHSEAIVHRDIKPRNFLLGSGLNGNVIYITDFGLAHEYAAVRESGRDDDVLRSKLIGTARFASIRGHHGQSQSPRDDLESLGYMLVCFLRGKLPWQGLEIHDRRERERKVIEEKMTISAERLCEGLPDELVRYMDTVKALRDGERPDYVGLRRDFQRLAERQGFRYDNIFDWTIRFHLEHDRRG